MSFDLPVKTRPSPSVRSLNTWVRDAVRLTGLQERRVGWMLASTVVIAALQRALGSDGAPLFLAKGGVYLEMCFGMGARVTKDVDTLFRGTVDEFLSTLADVMSVPWGPFTMQTSPVEVITGAKRIVKPRRFEVQLIAKGAVWRKVKVEVSFPEGKIADHGQSVPTPPIGFFGVDAPDYLVGIVMDYQVAQKIHACTDPDTDDWINDRVQTSSTSTCCTTTSILAIPQIASQLHVSISSQHEQLRLWSWVRSRARGRRQSTRTGFGVNSIQHWLNQLVLI